MATFALLNKQIYSMKKIFLLAVLAGGLAFDNQKW
jgi:hypothetical protein